MVWPGYRVYRHEISEADKTLKLWVRRNWRNRKLVCSGYRDLNYLLLKAQRLAATKTQFLVLKKAA